jgi:hypothetical protein
MPPSLVLSRSGSDNLGEHRGEFPSRPATDSRLDMLVCGRVGGGAFKY